MESQPAGLREFTDPGQGSGLTRLFRGFGYLLQGWSFVFSKHPSLLKLCLLPLLINLAVFAGVAVALYNYYGDLVNLIWSKPESWLLVILWYLLYIFIFLLIVLMAYVAFFVVQAILSAPFNDLLSERTELLAYGRQAPPLSVARLLGDLGRTLLHESSNLAIYLAVITPLFILNLLVPVVGPALFLIGGFYLSATFFAYDFMDFCMARRKWPFKRKWTFLKENKALTFGFGSALATALLVPLLGLLCMPMAAVGGTLLFCDLERAEEQEGGATPRGEKNPGSAVGVI